MNAWEYDHFNRAIQRIEEELLEIKKQGEHTMTLVSDLQAKIDAVNTAVATLTTDLTQAVADLKAAIAAGSSPDISAQLAALDTIVSNLGALDTTTKQADPGPTPPAA